MPKTYLLALMCMAVFSLSTAFAAPAQGGDAVAADAQQHFSDVVEQFNEEKALAAERAISDKSKHEILFWMGGALLLLILLAACFGVAMGIFDKDVFVWHVLTAGLATTLAIAHAVTAFVWFYPN